MTKVFYIWVGDELIGSTLSQNDANIVYEAGYEVIFEGNE